MFLLLSSSEASMCDVERKSKMSDLEQSSSKSNESKTVSSAGNGSLTLTGSCSIGNLLLQSGRSSNDDYGEDHKDPHEANKRRALSISCPMGGGGLHEGMVRWERNTLGEEEEGEDEEVDVQDPMYVDLGEAQMNI